MEPLLTFDSLKSRFSRTYYYINLVLSCIVFILRILNLPPFSIPSFYNFQIEWKIGAAVFVLILIKINRAASIEEGFGIFFLYAKIASLSFLYFSSSYWIYSLLYTFFCFATFILVPQPSYYGPGEVIPLNKEALNVFLDCKAKSTDSNKTPEVRILLLDTLWSTRCLNFQPVVASLSLKYTTQKIKFGRLDLDEDPEYEKEFSIDTSATSLQLPTIILYIDGVEVKRLPNARYDSKTNALSLWDRSEASVIKAFNLNELYEKNSADLD